MSNSSTNETAVASNGSVLIHSRCHGSPLCLTKELDTASAYFEKNESKYNHYTLLASLVLIFFVILVYLKVCSWYKEGSKRKARGEVGFDDDSELNYRIIQEGEKDHCKIEMRSDTTSVYDTVNSFRLFSNTTNGHATFVPSGNQDTIGSIRSLVMQRGDNCHYDSVKSYKAFLKQVTQNKDFDVEVSLLENYPVKCKSAEHCVVLEDGTASIHPWQTAKAALQGNMKSVSSAKKDHRYRRASGEPLGPMRKRSASNPTYNGKYKGASSLPSVHCSVSNDSSSNEEDTVNTLRMERKKAYEERCKKMSRSCSGGRLSKVPKVPEEDHDETPEVPVRKRHYSADGGSRRGKLPLCYGNKVYKLSRAFQHELNNLRESISETDPKPEEHVISQEAGDSSSDSDDPDSSPSPCNLSVSSDAIESDESDNEETTKLVIELSANSNSNDRIILSDSEDWSNQWDNSFDLRRSPQAHTPTSSSQQVNHKNGTDSVSVSANHQTVPNANGCFPSKSELEMNEHNENRNGVNLNVETLTSDNDNERTNTKYVLDHQVCDDNNSVGENNNSLSSPCVKVVTSSNSTNTNNHSPSSDHPFVPARLLLGTLVSEIDDSEDTDNSMASNPRRVKRFHVTSVLKKEDISSLNGFST